VVILSAKDALGDTIRPRLEAAGADLDRILGFRFEELPTIRDGLTVIEAAIKRVEAALVNHTARAKRRGSGSIGIIGAVRSALRR
jgi:hypothetical protein